MVKDVTIRMATVDDVLIIVHHRRAMFTDMGYPDPEVLDCMQVSFMPYITRALAEGTYRGWLAQTSDGRVVAGGGLIVHEWPSRPVCPAEPRRAYVLNVYTEPEYRGRGIARQIMANIVEWCRAQRIRWVSLHASVLGRPLYESLGFGPTNEMRLKLN